MSMYPIASSTVGSGGAASITFSSIPQTFTHLHIRAFGRSSGSSGTNMPLNFNSDFTVGNYYTHYIGGNGTNSGSPFSSSFTGSTDLGWVGGNTDTANTYGISVGDILDYTNTHKYKTVQAINGADFNTSAGLLGLWSGIWLSTAAITSLTITPSAGSFVQYSRIDLYGVSVSNTTGA